MTMNKPLLLDYQGDSLAPAGFVPRRGANLLLWVILGFFVVALAWAALTKIDRTVRGVGRVVPSSKLQVVSNLEGGVVEQILVKPGQTVRKGDILVRLSPMLTSAAFGSSSAEVDALQAKIARLNAEVRGTTPSYSAGAADQVAVERSLHSARSAELQGIMAAGAARASAMAEPARASAALAASTSLRATVAAFSALIRSTLEIICFSAIGRIISSSRSAPAPSPPPDRPAPAARDDV